MTGAEKERGEEGGRSPSHPAGGSSLRSPRTLIPGGGESFLLSGLVFILDAARVLVRTRTFRSTELREMTFPSPPISLHLGFPPSSLAVTPSGEVRNSRLCNIIALINPPFLSFSLSFLTFFSSYTSMNVVFSLSLSAGSRGRWSRPRRLRPPCWHGGGASLPHLVSRGPHAPGSHLARGVVLRRRGHDRGHPPVLLPRRGRPLVVPPRNRRRRKLRLLAGDGVDGSSAPLPLRRPPLRADRDAGRHGHRTRHRGGEE